MIRAEDWDLSAEVERQEATVAAIKAREYDRAIQHLCDDAVAEIYRPPLRSRAQHDFQPYPNPKVHGSCVRCGYPRSLHVD